MIRAVGFDLDGTLIDSTDAIVDSFLHTFRALDRPLPPRQAIVDTISMPLEEQFSRLIEGDPGNAPAIYREHYLREAPSKTVLLPGAEQALHRLRDAGLKLGIATSKRRAAAEVLLDHLGILGLFEACVGPEDVHHPKPHPEPIQRTMDLLGVSSAAMVFVGDTSYDVRSAHAAGVRCLCLTTGYANRAELSALHPEAVLDSLQDVAAHILGRNGPRQ